VQLSNFISTLTSVFHRLPACCTADLSVITIDRKILITSIIVRDRQSNVIPSVNCVDIKKQVREIKTRDITRSVSTKRRIESASFELIKLTSRQFCALFNEQANGNVSTRLINFLHSLKSQRFVLHFSNDNDGIICVTVLLVRGHVSESERNQQNVIYCTFAKNIENKCHSSSA